MIREPNQGCYLAKPTGVCGRSIACSFCTDQALHPNGADIPVCGPSGVARKPFIDTVDEFDMPRPAVASVIQPGAQCTVRIRPLLPGRLPFTSEFHADTAKGQSSPSGWRRHCMADTSGIAGFVGVSQVNRRSVWTRQLCLAVTSTIILPVADYLLYGPDWSNSAGPTLLVIALEAALMVAIGILAHRLLFKGSN